MGGNCKREIYQFLVSFSRALCVPLEQMQLNLTAYSFKETSNWKKTPFFHTRGPRDQEVDLGREPGSHTYLRSCCALFTWFFLSFYRTHVKRKIKCRIANILFHNKCSPRGSLEELTLGWFPVMLSDRFLFDLWIFLCIEFLNYPTFYVSSVFNLYGIRICLFLT